MSHGGGTRLQDRVAIVTGAGSPKGIGRAIALAYAREGAKVVAAGRSGVDAVAAEIAATGRPALAVTLDVANAGEVAALIRRTVETFGRIDILVNNAGFCEFRPFMEIDETLWRRTLDVNVTGYFLCGQGAARQMIAQGTGGRIINVTSISAEISGERKVHYCVTKAADKMLTQGMAVELARHGINVNAIAPGTIDTDIVRDPEIQRWVETADWSRLVPAGRIGTADDLTGAAIFLASSESNYVTGATILVDGGALAGTLFGD
jgi:NAD(P)-dependent dehydrogenase (short-subunit alcohol dehydrogenase family)